MNPVKAGTDAHPTGQHLNTSLALADNKHRWQRDAKLINDIVDKIPSVKINTPGTKTPHATKADKRTATLAANKANSKYLFANSEWELPPCLVWNELDLMATNGSRYIYKVDSYYMDDIMREIDRILTTDILGGSNFWTNRFFLNQYLSSASADGTTDSFKSAVNITKGTESEASMALLNAQQQLQTPAYNDRLRLISGRTFESMKGIVGEVESQLRLTLTEGMARGLSTRDIKGMINKRMGIGMGRAERIARTEINVAYTNAYMDESIELNETALKDDPWEIKQCQRSALSPTTRPSHRARHGLVFTVIQMREWWAVNGNRINCLCATLDVLVNRVTGEILQSNMIKRMRADVGDTGSAKV